MIQQFEPTQSPSRLAAQPRRGQVARFPRPAAARVSPAGPLSPSSVASPGPPSAAARPDAPSVGTPGASGKCPCLAGLAPVRQDRCAGATRGVAGADADPAPDLRTQIKIDLYATLRESSRSREQVADAEGISVGELKRQLSLDDGHRLGADQLPAVCRETRDFRLLHRVASACGHVALPLPEVEPGPEGLALALGDVEAELGEVWADYRDARRAGSEAGTALSEAERARLVSQLDDVLRCAAAARLLLGGGR